MSGIKRHTFTSKSYYTNQPQVSRLLTTTNSNQRITGTLIYFVHDDLSETEIAAKQHFVGESHETVLADATAFIENYIGEITSSAPIL